MYKVNPNAFADWSCDSAYWAGYLLADGYMDDIGRVGASSNDRSLLEALNAYVVESGEPIRTHGQRGYEWRVFDTPLCERLRPFGMTPRKSLTLRWPPVPSDLLGSFIRGYFDGDGCAGLSHKRYVYATFTSGAKPFLESLQEALHRNGITSYIYAKSMRANTLSITDRGSLIAFRHLIYDPAGTRLQRKAEILNRL